MSLFHGGIPPATDSDGDPISGATWNFYGSGGLTPLTVYSDSAFAVSLGATVTANSAGRFVPIYIKDSALTRAILKDALGSTIKDVDPVNSFDSNSVSYAELQDVSATSRILGRKTSGSGDPEECTLSEVLDFVGSAAQGDILYRGAATWARLAAGTSGQFLKTLGAANPAWADAGGWTYLPLASDFVTSSATAVDVTGLAFTPLANTTYEFEALLMVRTATATVGPRPGLAWPTGGTDGTASIYVPTAASTEAFIHGNINAAVLAPVGGLPDTTSSYQARIRGMFVAGATPSGTVKVQLASETAATNVTAVAKSFLRYRTTT